MGTAIVDQIGSDGSLLSDVDTSLTTGQKDDLLLAALPGSKVSRYAGERVVLYDRQVILRKQITYLGYPWDVFKKRIQIPNSWLAAYWQALTEGLTPRFVGIYHYADVTIFVDFEPGTYVRRKANNSAAHVSTNDLFQAQTTGLFSREDGNGNYLTSVRADLLEDYLSGRARERHPQLETFAQFNQEFLDGQQIEALTAVKEMHGAEWRDRFQGEWPGFYLEYRVNEFLQRARAEDLVKFQKAKRRDDFDYDLVFLDEGYVTHFGDLKASSVSEHESPGNDATDIERCVAEFGRFWYVVYEHETWHSRNEGHAPVIAWNEWRRSVGFNNRKEYNPLSYAPRFKSAVRFVRMMVVEVNAANFGLILRDFHQGQQPDGAARALKVMIDKRNIDNFLVHSESLH